MKWSLEAKIYLLQKQRSLHSSIVSISDLQYTINVSRFIIIDNRDITVSITKIKMMPKLYTSFSDPVDFLKSTNESCVY